MKEDIVVSLTSWKKRIGNLPVVLDTILSQTIQPDKIVVNLSREEFGIGGVDKNVLDYFVKNGIIVNWVYEDTKVWKKFLPTFSLFPNAVIIPIDDDLLYPPTMIEEFMVIHKEFPDDPISGNHYYRGDVKCHCGCASLVMRKHFDNYDKFLSKELMLQCPSSDLFYTYMASYNGYIYRKTSVDYSKVSAPYNPCYGYSNEINHNKLGVSERTLIGIFNMIASKYFDAPDPNKPFCVLGAANNEMGVKIERKMMVWLKPNFNLYVVRHDGSTYEYAAIRFLKIMAERWNKPFFYVHTKGAYYKRKCSHRVRRMWNVEFVDNQKKYLDIVNTDKPTVATPYTGSEKTTWYNGWCANASACKSMCLIKTSDRFYYEYKLFQNANVVGVRMSNITEPPESRAIMHKDLFDNFE